MKRSDLEAGKEYWYSRTPRWSELIDEGAKVVVVDTGGWLQPKSWGNRLEPRRCSGGTGVLADVTMGTITSRQVVNITHIRGPYNKTRQRIQEFEDARLARQSAERELNITRANEAASAIELARVHGIEARRINTQTADIGISAADLTKLINSHGSH